MDPTYLDPDQRDDTVAALLDAPAAKVAVDAGGSLQDRASLRTDRAVGRYFAAVGAVLAAGGAAAAARIDPVYAPPAAVPGAAVAAGGRWVAGQAADGLAAIDRRYDRLRYDA